MITGAAPPPRLLDEKWNRIVPAALLVAYVACAASARVAGDPALLLACGGAGLALGWALFGVVLQARRSGRRLGIEVDARKQHGLQLLAQGTVMTYWAFNWQPVVDHV